MMDTHMLLIALWRYINDLSMNTKPATRFRCFLVHCICFEASPFYVVVLVARDLAGGGLSLLAVCFVALNLSCLHIIKDYQVLTCVFPAILLCMLSYHL